MRWLMKPTYFKWVLTPVLTALGLSAATSQASEHSFLVQVRDGKNLKAETRSLGDLESDNSFDGKYFKIVKGRSEDAVRFDAEPETVFRAATVYYHMSVARAYFKGLYPDLKPLDEKHTIRVQVTLSYNQAIKMDAEEIDRDGVKTPNPTRIYNYALTIPKSDALRSRSVEPWGVETWFYEPQKIVRDDTSSAQIGQLLNSSAVKEAMTLPMLEQDISTITIQAIRAGVESIDYKTSLISIALSIGIPQILPYIVQGLSKMIKITYYADTAMIPEIIYHEYSHIAFSETLSPRKEGPLTEGLANYFAAKISGLNKIGAHAKRLVRGYVPQKINAKTKYGNDMDFRQATFHSSFVPSMIMNIDHAIGGSESSHLGEKVMALAAAKYWQPDSPIHLHPSDTLPKVSFSDGLYQAIQELHRSGVIQESSEAVFTRVLKVAADDHGI